MVERPAPGSDPRRRGGGFRTPGAGIVRAPSGAAWLRSHPAANDNKAPLTRRLVRFGLGLAVLAGLGLALWAKLG